MNHTSLCNPRPTVTQTRSGLELLVSLTSRCGAPKVRKRIRGGRSTPARRTRGRLRPRQRHVRRIRTAPTDPPDPACPETQANSNEQRGEGA